MSASNLLIRQARVLIDTISGALSDRTFQVSDVLVRNGQIAQIAPEIVSTSQTEESEPDLQVIDAAGLTLLPGVIDPQVHFREPGLEYKEDLFTASCACARGGVTSFLEMPNTKPLTTT